MPGNYGPDPFARPGVTYNPTTGATSGPPLSSSPFGPGMENFGASGGYGSSQTMQPQMPGSAPFGGGLQSSSAGGQMYGQPGGSIGYSPSPTPQTFNSQPPSGGFSSPGSQSPGQGNPLGQQLGTLFGQPWYGGAPQSPGASGSQPMGQAPQGGWGQMANQPYQQSPYLKQQFEGLQQSFNNNLTRNVLPSIQSGAGAVGGIGGARQGIAQGLAIGDSQAGLANAMANLAGQSYESDMNRNLQGYGIDQSTGLGYFNGSNNYSLGQGQLGLGYTQAGNQYDLGKQQNANQRYGMDQNYNLGQGQLGLGYFNGQNQYNLGQGQLDLQGQQQQQNFFNTQGSQDIQRYLAGLQGYQMSQMLPYQQLGAVGGVFSPWAGNGTTTQNSSQGGGAMGAAGGALGGLQLWNLLNQGG